MANLFACAVGNVLPIDSLALWSAAGGRRRVQNIREWMMESMISCPLKKVFEKVCRRWVFLGAIGVVDLRCCCGYAYYWSSLCRRLLGFCGSSLENSFIWMPAYYISEDENIVFLWRSWLNNGVGNEYSSRKQTWRTRVNWVRVGGSEVRGQLDIDLSKGAVRRWDCCCTPNDYLGMISFRSS